MAALIHDLHLSSNRVTLLLPDPTEEFEASVDGDDSGSDSGSSDRNSDGGGARRLKVQVRGCMGI